MYVHNVSGTLKTSSCSSHSFCPPLSMGLHPSVLAPQLWSFHHFYLSLACCAFSPHRFTSSLPLCLHTNPFSSLLFSFTKAQPCTPAHSIVLSLLDIILFFLPLQLPLPPSPRVLLLVIIMHNAISYQFAIVYFLLGIHNPLHTSLSAFCSSWPAFHPLYYVSPSFSASHKHLYLLLCVQCPYKKCSSTPFWLCFSFFQISMKKHQERTTPDGLDYTKAAMFCFLTILLFIAKTAA